MVDGTGGGGEVTLAGDVAIRVGGRTFAPVRAGSAQVQLTFGALVLGRDRGVSADDLAALLWPDGGDSHGNPAAHLRNLVSWVRKPLDAAFGAGTLPLRPAGGVHRVVLPPGVTVDVEEAARALGVARARLAAGDHSGARPFAVAAADRAGPRLLPAVDTPWATDRRRRLAEVWFGAQEVLADAALARGDAAEALDAAIRMTQRDPLRVGAHARLLRAYAGLGDRGAAEQALHRLGWRLGRAEQRQQLPPELVELFDELFPPAPLPPAIGAGGLPAPPAARTWPFVGRAAALAAIDDAWAGACAGSPQVVLASGEAGIGLTRLALEVAGRVRAAGGRALRGRCDRDGTVAHQPLVEALGAVLSTAPAGELRGVDRAGLAPLLPPTLPPPPPSSPGGSPGAGGSPVPDVPGVPAAVLATAVAGALTALAADQPTLLVLDDLQWSAPETLVVLRRAVREVAPGSALLVLALARDDGTHPAGPLAGALGPLAGDGLLTRVRLGGLTEAEGRDLAAATGSVRAADARRLTAEAAGNPFLLTHLLAAAGPAADGTRLPDAVGGWVADRLAEAGADAAALVRAGALGGPGFELDLVAAVAGLDATAGLDAADAAVAAHLLVEERGGPPGRFRFVHPVVRRAVVEGLGPTRRQALHRRTAAVLAEHRRDSPDHLAAAATHALDGAPPGPDGEAVARALAAAHQALADGDPVTAVDLLNRAHPHLPEHDSALTARLLVARGQASLAVAALHGTPDAAAADLLAEGATHARGAHRVDLAAEAALTLAATALARRVGRADRSPIERQALALADLVLAMPGADNPAHARLQARRAELARTPLATPPRGAVGDVARELAALAGPDALDERDAVARDLEALARAAGDPDTEQTATHARAAVAAYRSEPATVRRLLSPEGGPRPGDPDRGRARRRWLTAESARDGWFLDVDDLDVGEADVDPDLRLVVAWMRGRLHDGPPRRPEHPVAAALVAVDGGDPERARVLLLGVGLGVDRLPPGDGWLSGAAIAALAAAQLGDRRVARQVHGLLSPYADLSCGHGFQSFVGAAAHHLGCLELVMGEYAAAARHLEQAFATHARLDARPWTALTRHALALALDAGGNYRDRDVARDHREEAAGLAAACGLRPLDEMFTA